MMLFSGKLSSVRRNYQEFSLSVTDFINIFFTAYSNLNFYFFALK